MNVRALALEIINKVLNEGGYSNLLLSEAISSNELRDLDIGLLTQLVYGTIQYKLTLDYYLEDFIANKKIRNNIRNILRLSVYQLKYLDRVPDYAIINESVNLAKEESKEAANFVNAVLRNIIRTGLKDPEEITDELKRLSVTSSHPLWLVSMWAKQYNLDTAKKICELNNVKPYQFARLNLFKDKKANILERLNRLKISYNLHPLLEEAIYFSDDNIANLSIYKEGYLNVQDISSMLVAKILDPKPNERIIDVCAAPGGKSTHIAELMGDKGEVISCDIHEHKIRLIEYNSRRLGLKSVKPMLVDATKLSEYFPPCSFDRVLVDAPCSGFGVIRRKPEIKYNKEPKDIDEIIMLQRKIIDEAVKLVRDNGTLVYSTCTINKKENEKMVDYLLSTYKEFSLNSSKMDSFQLGTKGFVQIIEEIKDADIFFIACFTKNKKV